MGVGTDHVFDVRLAIEARGVSVVNTAIRPIGGHRVALHEKSVGVRPIANAHRDDGKAFCGARG